MIITLDNLKIYNNKRRKLSLFGNYDIGSFVSLSSQTTLLAVDENKGIL